MREFHIRHWLLLLGALATLLPFSGQVHAQGPTATNNLAALSEFLRFVYPEIHQTKEAWTEFTFGAPFSGPDSDLNQVTDGKFTVWSWSPRMTKPTTGPVVNGFAPLIEQKAQKLMDGGFGFFPDGQLGIFVVANKAFNDRQAEFHKVFVVDSGWSQERFDKELKFALKKFGARYGPDDKEALIKAIPVDGLRPFLGIVTIESADLYGTGWTVSAKARWTGAEPRSYILRFDAFEGKLISVWESSWAP